MLSKKNLKTVNENEIEVGIIPILLGDRWVINGSEWRIVGSIKNDLWPMSGPGPCRSVKYMSEEEIITSGELVFRESVYNNA